jgi:tripartite-type tricarboxylate transporter receptor subunit TctC
MSSTRGCVAVALACLCTAGTASAQNYPIRPVRMIVPYPAGGTSDILARLIGAKLTETWGQQILVDNRTGAGGNIGAEITARAAPDGYTLMLTDIGNLTIFPSIYAKLPYDLMKDFAPVTTVSYSSHLLGVHPSVPARTVKELIALAKANPDRLNYPTALGGAPHLAGLMLQQRTGIKWTYIPTKGGAASTQVISTGEADVLFLGMLQLLPHVKNGRVRAVAVSSAKRDPALPDVPAVAETPGLEGFVTGSFQGILAPARTSPEIVAKIQTDVARALALPDVREKLLSQGTGPVANSPQETASWLAAEKDRWAKVIKATGFKLEQ